MVSGVKDEETPKKALELGAADYITKPVDLEYLNTSLVIEMSSLLDDIKKTIGA